MPKVDYNNEPILPLNSKWQLMQRIYLRDICTTKDWTIILILLYQTLKVIFKTACDLIHTRPNLTYPRMSYYKYSIYLFTVSEISFNQTIEAPITNSDKVTLSGNVTTRDGTGSGTVGCSLRRITSEKSWHEFSGRYH